MKTYHEWTTEEVLQRLEKGENFIIIDVREPEEFQAGRVPGSKLIPMGTIPDQIDLFDSNTEYILVCRRGNRSGRVCEYLSALGKKVINMQGGMLEWEGEVENG